METISLFAAKAWTFIISLLPAAFGSAVSVWITRNKDGIGKCERFLSFVIGVVIAKVFGVAAIEYFKIDPTSVLSIAIIMSIGLFGMGLVTQIHEQLPDIVRSLRFNDFVSSIFNRKKP